MRANAALSAAIAVVIGSLLIGCRESLPNEWNQIAAKAECGSRIKKLLRDPDSYRFESVIITSQSGRYNQYGSARITFSAKNGFGSYTNGAASCVSYQKGNKKWITALLD